MTVLPVTGVDRSISLLQGYLILMIPSTTVPVRTLGHLRSTRAGPGEATVSMGTLNFRLPHLTLDRSMPMCFSVNLGGLFVLEPFISPALFQKYPGATDEWSLSTLMAADTGSGGLKQLEDHYNTFIVSADHISPITSSSQPRRRPSKISRK